MIEFSGKLLNKCKENLKKWDIRVILFSCLVAVLILCIPTLIVAIVLKTWLIPIAIIIIIVVAGIGLSVSFLFEIMKVFDSHLPQKVTIEKTTVDGKTEEIIAITSEKEYKSRPISTVKKVIDKDEWYHVKFYLGYRSNAFVCQKNLITKGTIEEFEKLFEGKIVRKFKTTKNAD